ncbi:MAG TPA: hypothetical protein EYP60_04150 [bacterium (Candidatus Stahlbacteria)]|nr:hypothetical protein [Candidatus Stahlbacteria bacterium]
MCKRIRAAIAIVFIFTLDEVTVEPIDTVTLLVIYCQGNDTQVIAGDTVDLSSVLLKVPDWAKAESMGIWNRESDKCRSRLSHSELGWRGCR